jgi:hypothetical protein
VESQLSLAARFRYPRRACPDAAFFEDIFLFPFDLNQPIWLTYGGKIGIVLIEKGLSP